MDIDIISFLIVCPLAFLAGLVDAVAGGGGLISLPAYLIAGLPPHFAIGTNKLSSCMGTALATWKFARSGYVAWKLAGACAVCALFASAAGARMAILVDEAVFSYLLLIILPLTAAYVFRCKRLDVEREPLGTMETWLISITVAVFIGIYDGFYGPGTGTFLILLLMNFAHMRLAKANGLTKVINLTTNLSALAVLLFYGKVLLVLGFVAGFFNIVGNYLGAELFERNGGKIAKPLILFVLGIFILKIIVEKFESYLL